MKKLFVMVLVLTLLFAAVPTALALVPGKEGAVTQETIATFTIKFLYPDGSGGSGTYEILEQPGETHDKTIEDTLKGIWNNNSTYIHSITHVNGVPIVQTKWAKYGGPIPWDKISNNKVVTPPEKPVKSNEVFVFINGHKVTFPDQQPYIKNNRTMVPLRAVFEDYDVQAEVQWVPESRTVIAKDRTGRTIIFRIGDKNFDIVDTNGVLVTYTNDVAPEITNNRTMLPLRALAEGLNFDVDWIDSTRVVDIKEKPGYDRRLMGKDAWAEYVKEFNAKEEAKLQGGVSQ